MNQWKKICTRSMHRSDRVTGKTCTVKNAMHRKKPTDSIDKTVIRPVTIVRNHRCTLIRHFVKGLP